VIWDRQSGNPIHNAIVWQDRRTADLCDRMISCGVEEVFHKRTGLLLDPYFSGTKINWLLDSVPGARRRAERGELAFGTIDTFLLWRLTGGAVHATDVSNASRTLLFNLHTLEWDCDLLEHLSVPSSILPLVMPSSGFFGETAPDHFGRPIPITGIAGDQQAATFGQACFRPGMVKNTYGTGSFLLMNTGDHPHISRNRLLTTVGWQLQAKETMSMRNDAARPSTPELKDSNAPTTFALEGSIFVTGAAIQWLRDDLGIIQSAADTADIAASVSDTGGVYFVPAFVGLGAPYWDSRARGALVGLTRGAGRAEIVRAALEAACFQTRDVIEAMQSDSGVPLSDLRVDGGMSANNTMLQIQADILGIPVHRPAITETTSLGAAYLAGLGAGVWGGVQEIEGQWRIERTFEPNMSREQREEQYSGWKRAVERVRG
jgi:glycerol kinase